MDTTFNTNQDRLPLEVLTGIDPTGKTFPFCRVYTTGETAVMFRFLDSCLRELIFQGNVPWPEVGVGGFAAGLTKADKEAREEEIENAEREGRESEKRWKLQYCNWHAVEAIKRKLVAVGKYSKEKREDLNSLIWQWVQSPTISELNRNRAKLRRQLQPEEQRYLEIEYQPKEAAFMTAYTKTYANLGVHSTQRGEGYHPQIKAVCHRTKPLHEAVRAIQDLCKTLAPRLDERINENRRNLPRLLDRQAFRVVGKLLTHFALNKISLEWEETKKIGLRVENEEDEELEFEMEASLGEPGCLSVCEYPQRWGLPCRHWLYQCFVSGDPIPLDLIHPRWLLDASPASREPWIMGAQTSPKSTKSTTSSTTSSDSEDSVQSIQIPATQSVSSRRHSTDRYRDRGGNMVNLAAHHNLGNHSENLPLDYG